MFREESENPLRHLHISLESERVAEHDRPDTQKTQETEPLKAKSEKELQEENRRLKELKGPVQEELNGERLKLRSDTVVHQSRGTQIKQKLGRTVVM